MRYLPLTDADRKQMLDTIGISSIDELFRDVPESARLTDLVDLPKHKSEMEVERIFGRMADRNIAAATVPCFVGGGAYHHHVPATVDHLIQRGEFLTSYTPYQPEITQGTLQYLFEFQTQVALLTGMDVANASMYDGATSCAEAVLMASRVTRRQRSVISGNLHPHYAETTETLAGFTGFDLDRLAPAPTGEDDAALIDRIDDRTAAVVVQVPDMFGNLRDLRPIAEAAHARGALLIAVVTEVVSLGAIASPGEMGADIVVAEGQSFGNPVGFGGPHVGLFATREKYLRQMPGRLCGETVDAEGRRGYVLTLSTREQHIRREKATSNICTNSGLCALAFTIHLSLLGEAGLMRLAELNHERAVGTAERLTAIPGVELLTDSFFNEFSVRLPKPAAEVVEALATRNVLGGIPASRLLPDAGLDDVLMVAATEMVTDEDEAAFADALREVLAS